MSGILLCLPISKSESASLPSPSSVQQFTLSKSTVSRQYDSCCVLGGPTDLNKYSSFEIQSGCNVALPSN